MAELYHDVDVVERVEVQPDGRILKVYRVSAVTKSGTRFSVHVSQADFNKQNVDKILTQKAEEIEEIRSL